MVSSFVLAKFKGLFGDQVILRIKISGWNLLNPLKILTYSLPLLVIFAVILALVYTIKFLFGTYTLRLTKQEVAQNTFIKLLLTYTDKQDDGKKVGSDEKAPQKEIEL